MENQKNNGMLTAVILLLLAIIMALVVYIVYDKSTQTKCEDDKPIDNVVDDNTSNDEEITLDDLIGTYNWNTTYTNDDKAECELKATLKLNKDHTATYEYTDCSETVNTSGIYNYVGDEVIYTADDTNAETTFNVLNKNTLENQTVLENKIVRLTK